MGFVCLACKKKEENEEIESESSDSCSDNNEINNNSNIILTSNTQEIPSISTDIVIKTGNFKRSIPLPNVLRTYMVSGAKLEDGKLRISFVKEDEDDVQ